MAVFPPPPAREAGGAAVPPAALGDLAELAVLDTRQSRDDQPCAGNGVGRAQVVVPDGARELSAPGRVQPVQAPQDPGRLLLAARDGQAVQALSAVGGVEQEQLQLVVAWAQEGVWDHRGEPRRR
jgi:hypothetical protein